MTWSLSLLGPLIVRVHPDQPVTLTSKKAQALLAYLAVESARPHSREALAGLLWPDYAARAARSSLRQAVQIVRLGRPHPRPGGGTRPSRNRVHHRPAAQGLRAKSHRATSRC
jgi:hypothetical protein